MKLAKYFHLFTNRENPVYSCIFDPLSLKLCYLNTRLISKSICVPIGEYHYLIDKKNILNYSTFPPLIFPKDNHYRNIHLDRINNTAILHFTLNYKCNLQCGYCWRRSVDKRRYIGRNSLELSESKAISYINKFFNEFGRTCKILTIVFYGTEVFLSKRLLFNLIDYIEKKKDQKDIVAKIEIVINTNGTLIERSDAHYIAQKNVNCIVSLDGPQEIHDYVRQYPSGKGSFKDVARGIKLLKTEGVNTAISTTINSSTQISLIDILEFIYFSYDPTWIGINLIENEDNEEILVKNAISIMNCYLRAREIGIVMPEILKRVVPFIFQKHRINDCSSCSNCVRISPEGWISACHHFFNIEEFCCRDYDETIPFSKIPEIRRFQDRRTQINDEKCTQCAAISICGAGCPSSAFIQFGGINFRDRRICVQSNVAIETMIWDLFQLTKGNQRVSHERYFIPNIFERMKILGNIDIGRANLFMLGYHLLN